MQLYEQRNGEYLTGIIATIEPSQLSITRYLIDPGYNRDESINIKDRDGLLLALLKDKFAGEDCFSDISEYLEDHNIEFERPMPWDSYD